MAMGQCENNSKQHGALVGRSLLTFSFVLPLHLSRRNGVNTACTMFVKAFVQTRHSCSAFALWPVVQLRLVPSFISHQIELFDDRRILSPQLSQLRVVIHLFVRLEDKRTPNDERSKTDYNFTFHPQLPCPGVALIHLACTEKS